MSVTSAGPWELAKGLESFGADLPHTRPPYSARNWGHPLHSLCSYQGKLKPSLVAKLLELALPRDASVLDPLGGVGTVAFEAAMTGRRAWSNDLSPFPYLVATGKLAPPTLEEADAAISAFALELAEVSLTERDWAEADFGLNATVRDYFHETTLEDVLRARKLLSGEHEVTPTRAFIWACLLHVLHGNRPYALSRTSHPITPFSPRGPFVEKDLVGSVRDKARRALELPLPAEFCPAVSLRGDFRTLPARLDDQVDAIVTSPPFIGMRFDRPNWLRLWFCGWEASTFHETKTAGFLERQQTKDRECYRDFFRVSAELLPSGGILIAHVGAGPRGDLAADLLRLAPAEFTLEADVVEEVAHIERHGISDKRRTPRQHLLGFVRR
ncbi:MAG: hypothetical protein ABW167_13010 [Baekduia sp.]